MSDIDTLFAESADWLQGELIKAGDLKADTEVVKQNIDKLKKAAAESFSDKLATKLVDTHTTPLRRVVGLLPIDELADLAEILISIESLKERVTRTTESVGGPVDVAVISKSDGFIWIKRKHYFDPALNSRYFARKGMSHG